MGRYGAAEERTGFGIPPDGSRHSDADIEHLLALADSPVVIERQLAAKNLCTCHVQADDARVAAKLLELFNDPDVRVRSDVLHALTDSTSSGRVPVVLAALEARRNDPDPRLRRRIRRTMAHYGRTGKITDAPR